MKKKRLRGSISNGRKRHQSAEKTNRFRMLRNKTPAFPKWPVSEHLAKRLGVVVLGGVELYM